MSQNTREQIRNYLFGTLIPTPKGEWPADDTDLFNVGMDSLRLMQLLVFVEEKLHVRLPDQEVTPDRIESVNSLVEWIDATRAAR